MGFWLEDTTELGSKESRRGLPTQEEHHSYPPRNLRSPCIWPCPPRSRCSQGSSEMTGGGRRLSTARDARATRPGFPRSDALPSDLTPTANAPSAHPSPRAAQNLSFATAMLPGQWGLTPAWQFPRDPRLSHSAALCPGLGGSLEQVPQGSVT